jgi:hypothetical protein
MSQPRTVSQKELIVALENLCPANMSLADILADLLQVSKDSAYRRIRGETIIDLNELILISKHFRISLDSLIGFTSNSVVFNYNPIKTIDDYKVYLTSIIRDLGMLTNFEQVRVVYAAQDIPLFHNFRFEKLARFKLFYWLRSIVNIEDMQGKRFEEDAIDNELLYLGKELYDAYSRVPSEEIWTEITPVSLFKQVDFCWSSGLFVSQEQALAVCDDIQLEFTRLEEQAKSGIKITSSGQASGFKKNFRLYLSEIEIGNNCIYTEINGQKHAYLAFNTFNKISTANQPFCEEIERWLNNLITKSTPISEVSEKHRYRFFKKLHRGLEEVRTRILSGE